MCCHLCYFLSLNMYLYSVISCEAPDNVDERNTAQHQVQYKVGDWVLVKYDNSQYPGGHEYHRWRRTYGVRYDPVGLKILQMASKQRLDFLSI